MTERLARHLDRLFANLSAHLTSVDQSAASRDWTAQRVGEVRFDDSLRVAVRSGGRLLAAAGCRPLGAHVRFGSVASGAAVRLSPPPIRPEAEGLLEALGRVWGSGVDIDFDPLTATSGARGVLLPTKSIDRRECWIAPPARRHDTASAGASTGGTA